MDDTLTVTALLDDLERRLDKDERTLRNQTGGPLSATAEKALAGIAAEAERLPRVLRRYAYIRHLFFSASEGLGEGAGDAREAMAQLMARDPVMVELPRRTVPVTGRSWEAMRLIARHHLAILENQVHLAEANRIMEEVREKLRQGTGAKAERSRWRRHIRRLGGVVRHLLYETSLHRQALYAHIFNPSPAPAASLDDVPEWWVEVSPVDDALVMRAMWEAGPGRYTRTLDPSDPDTPSDGYEKYGFHSHFAHISHQEHVPPAEPYLRDFYQHLTYMRALAEALKSRQDAKDDEAP